MASTSVVFDILANDRASDKFDHLGRSVGGSSSMMSKFTGVMKTAGKAAAVGLGAGLVIAAGAGVKFAQAAAQDEQSANLMANALRKNAQASDDQIKSVEDWISVVGRQTGVADDDLRPALSRLVTATHDVGKAQQLARLAMDVSAGSGKSLEAVSTALMKAQNGQVSSLSRLGINTKNAAGETISMDAAVQRMADTFGGAAATKAGTMQGKMDRLKLILSETGEAIGYKLIPMVSSMADWFLNKAMPAIGKVSDWLEVHLVPVLQDVGHWISDTVVPAVQKFADEMRSGEGAGGKFADVLGKMRDALSKAYDVLKPVFEFMANNKTVVATFAGVILTVVAAVKVWTAVQAALNVVMSANPLGLVVVAVAALAAGLVYAYKKSETFRDIVNGAFELVGKAGRSLWNDFLQPVIRFMIDGFGYVLDGIGEVFDALGHVPGFGWAKDAAAKMHGAADAAHALADDINKIPNTKTINVNVVVNTSAIAKVQHQLDTLGGTYGRAQAGGRGMGSGPFGLGGNSVGGAGAALIDSIVSGISKGKVKLQTALDKLKDYIQKHQDKLAELIGKRREIVDAFKGFASSIFGADVSGEGGGPSGLAALLAFQADQKAKAQQLQADVGTLIAKGISKDLLTQLQGAGAAGEEQIHLLAGATAEQLAQANADNAATLAALQAAGLAASEAQGVEAAIRQEEANIKLADTIKGKLQELLDLQDKNTIVELHLDGQKIYVSLKKLKKQLGHGLDL